MSHTPEQDAGRTGRTADSRASRSRFTVEKDAGERPAGGRAAEWGQATEACGEPCFRKRGSPSRLVCWMSTGPRGAELGRQPHPPWDSGVKNEHGPLPTPTSRVCARRRSPPSASVSVAPSELLREPRVHGRAPGPRGGGLGPLGAMAPRPGLRGVRCPQTGLRGWRGAKHSSRPCCVLHLLCPQGSQRRGATSHPPPAARRCSRRG